MLSNNLNELQQEAETLKEIQEGTEEMRTSSDKQRYIEELEDIARAQATLLHHLNQQPLWFLYQHLF